MQNAKRRKRVDNRVDDRGRLGPDLEPVPGVRPPAVAERRVTDNGFVQYRIQHPDLLALAVRSAIPSGNDAAVENVDPLAYHGVDNLEG